jgi:DNA helicase INO80
MREMQVFWKKNEKEERDVRKREQKEAMDRLKIEEEKREAARQARKLEFLISQTELYSHFVGSKLKSKTHCWSSKFPLYHWYYSYRN